MDCYVVLGVAEDADEETISSGTGRQFGQGVLARARERCLGEFFAVCAPRDTPRGSPGGSPRAQWLVMPSACSRLQTAVQARPMFQRLLL
jgi:hypothetical protein